MVGRERDRLVDRPPPRRQRLARQPEHQVEAEIVESGRTRLADGCRARGRPSESDPAARSSSSSNDCTPKLMRLTPASRNAASRSGVAVSGLVSSVISASGAIAIRVATRLDRAARSRAARAATACRRRRRSCRAGRDRRRLRADLALERGDVSRLQLGVEQTAIEVAVAADGRAERNVEIETEHVRARPASVDPRPISCRPALPPGHFSPLAARGSARGPGPCVARRAACASASFCLPERREVVRPAVRRASCGSRRRRTRGTRTFRAAASAAGSPTRTFSESSSASSGRSS